MRVRTGCTRGVSLLHRCSHPGSLTLLLRPSTTADCVRRRQPGSICDSVLGDDRGSPCGNACMRRAESDQGTGGELPQGHRRNHPRIGGVSFATAFALRLFLPRMTKAGHQLRRRFRRRLSVLRSVLTAITTGVTDWGRWSNIIIV